MSTGYQDQSIAQWDQLIALIQKEMNVGSNGQPGTGTNVAGRLQHIWTVEESIAITGGVYPAIGVQLVKIPEEQYAQHTHKLLTRFKIVLAACDVPVAGSGNVASLSAAMRSLKTNMDDANGNGLGPVLRDPANRTLNGTAQTFRIVGCNLDWRYDNPSEAALAYAVYDLEVTNLVGI